MMSHDIDPTVEQSDMKATQSVSEMNGLKLMPMHAIPMIVTMCMNVLSRARANMVIGVASPVFMVSSAKLFVQRITVTLCLKEWST